MYSFHLGTPGVGKSTICQRLADRTNYAWREVSKIAEESNCLDEYDPEYQCPFLNEDKVRGKLYFYNYPSFKF